MTRRMSEMRLLVGESTCCAEGIGSELEWGWGAVAGGGGEACPSWLHWMTWEEGRNKGARGGGGGGGVNREGSGGKDDQGA